MGSKLVQPQAPEPWNMSLSSGVILSVISPYNDYIHNSRSVMLM